MKYQIRVSLFHKNKIPIVYKNKIDGVNIVPEPFVYKKSDIGLVTRVHVLNAIKNDTINYSNLNTFIRYYMAIKDKRKAYALLNKLKKSELVQYILHNHKCKSDIHVFLSKMNKKLLKQIAIDI